MRVSRCAFMLKTVAVKGGTALHFIKELVEARCGGTCLILAFWGLRQNCKS
jgi:hypothetical protein